MTVWDDATVRERVWDHISGARWFSGKGRCGSLTRLLPLAPVVNEQDLQVLPVIAHVGYPQATRRLACQDRRALRCDIQDISM